MIYHWIEVIKTYRSYKACSVNNNHIFPQLYSRTSGMSKSPSPPAQKSPAGSRLKSTTAKRSPSILVTDARKSQIKAPFAGHKQERIQRTNSLDRSPRTPSWSSSSNLKNRRQPTVSKFSDISVSNIISNISDIPSSRQREITPRYGATASGYGGNESIRSGPRMVSQYYKTLPSRTSKMTHKLVLIPDSEQLQRDEHQHQQQDHILREQQQQQQSEATETTTVNIFEGNYVRTRAEKLSKDKRATEYPRVTAYLISEGFDLSLTSKFLAKHHMVSPRLYDEALYVPYSLPLLPGDNGYRVQSNNSAKMAHGNQLMENFLDKVEQRDHHYEFYSAEEGPGERQEDIGQSPPLRSPIGSLGDSEFQNDQNNLHNSEFDPSEPQFFVSSSPTESILEEEMERERQDHESSVSSDGTNDSSNNTDSPEQFIKEVIHEKGHDSLLSDQFTSHNSSAIDDSAPEHEDKYEEKIKNRRSSSNSSLGKKKFQSNLPDLSKHAEVFILDYGVVVFWNFTEVHEKNILADLVFAKIHPGEFELDDDEDENDGEANASDNLLGVITSQDSVLSTSSPDNELESITFIIKPVPEHAIETEEFHFEYIRDIQTPRIYNDMITLKSGDHLIKLTISHAIAQSTKLSMFESKMSNILNSISKLPKALALTGKLQNYTRKKLLIKTGKLFQLRNEVNLSSNVLDTPEYFWSIEPGLDPLYTAIREYLEIDQRVEVINDRCKVFLDFFDILADSLAERTMTKITMILIVAIGLSVLVSILEIMIRYLLISRATEESII